MTTCTCSTPVLRPFPEVAAEVLEAERIRRVYGTWPAPKTVPLTSLTHGAA